MKSGDPRQRKDAPNPATEKFVIPDKKLKTVPVKKEDDKGPKFGN